MKKFIIIIYFMLIGLLFSGCLGHGNLKSFVELQNRAIKNKHENNNTWIQKYNSELDPYKKPKLTSHDLDALPITIKTRDDGNLEYHYSLAAVGIHGKYYNYYRIVDKGTNQYIDWEFVYCDKDKIDFDDEETYKECLKDTRLTRETDDVYRIGVSRVFRKKYGYDIHQEATLENDLKMVKDVLDKEGVCKNGDIEIVRNIFVKSGGVRYMVRCNNE